MTTRSFLLLDGTERLVVSTICRHAPFFHEAGFAYWTQRRERIAVTPWNPLSWSGVRWTTTAEVAQPSDVQCVFIQRDGIERDPQDFDATTEVRDGSVKLTCEYLLSRAHCIDVVRADQPASIASAEEARDARSVVNLRLRFTYGGAARTFWHAAPRRSVCVDNASTRAR